MCEAAEQTDLNWPLAVANFPAETDGEKRWKDGALRGISLCTAEEDKDHSRLIPDRSSQRSCRKQ